MRRLVALAALVPALAAAQAQPKGVWDAALSYAAQAAGVASAVRQDIIIQVSRHPMGADMVEISAVNPSYPPDLLRAQVLELGKMLRMEPRGLVVGSASIGNDPRLRTTRAGFATNGLIDREGGTLNLLPLLKAFAGAPEPYTVRGLDILFNGEVATGNMLRTYASPYVRLEAITVAQPPMVEYHVQLLTQDPSRIDLPAKATNEQKQPPSASTEQRNGVDWAVWIPLVLAALAAGVLVYFVMLKLTTRPSR